MNDTPENLFQVDLRGVVDVLAKHLYSSPAVFVREVLQNAIDAISARQRCEPEFAGEVVFEVDEPTGTLTVIDDGIGLTPDQIVEFLACVGATSKVESAEDVDRSDFVGQFGIGVLSTFMVADEVVVLTRSLEPGAPSLEWRGSADGRYTMRKLDTELAIGTRVILQVRQDSAEFAELARIYGLVRRYGGCLDVRVLVQPTASKGAWDRELVSQKRKLWLLDGDDALSRAGWALDFTPLDALEIQMPEIGLHAVGYVLPRPAASIESGLHLLYLKGLFVTDHDVAVVPPWATFVRFVIHSTELKPTASRESIREDEAFHRARNALAAGLRDYLHRLARERRRDLDRFVSIHDAALRQVALEDQEFFKMIIDLLPFETSMGGMKFGRFRADNTTVRLAHTQDQFRTCATLAAAQGVVVFNGGYTAHAELLERAVAMDPSLTLEIVDARQLIDGIGQVADAEERRLGAVIADARRALARLDCGVRLRAFEPVDVPAVFAEGPDQSLARSVGAVREVSEDPTWNEVLDALDGEIDASVRGSFVCLNANSPVVQALGDCADPELRAATIRVLYVQALLLGRQPLTSQETELFSDALRFVLTRKLLDKGGETS